jgi:hypothetical protein
LSDTWQTKLNANPVPWLLKSEPWTRLRTMTDLLGISPASAEVKKAKKESTQHPKIQQLVQETAQWFPARITRHDNSNNSNYKIALLAELGVLAADKDLKSITDQVLSHTENGLLAVRQDLPLKDKINVGEGEWHALPCDSPQITYALLLMGMDNPVITQTIEKLKEKWETPQGWFCHFSFVDSQYKKYHAGCPMAGLMALEAFSQIPELKESRYAKNAFEPLLFHKELGESIYYFGRAKRFWTFKYPFVWYNALYLGDVLTRFGFLKGNPIVKEIVDWIEESQDEQGRFKPTSTWMPYKDWEFGNKKEASPWITMICCRILKRWYD